MRNSTSENLETLENVGFCRKFLEVLHLFVFMCCRYGAKWESSFLCRFSGFLCVFASQTSLFLLTVAALERCLAAAQRNKTEEHSGEKCGEKR